jgi:hypothetical protein
MRLTPFDRQLEEAEHKALDSLSRYKFMQFGYWAAIWVHLNHISGERRPNPFRRIVHAARAEKIERFLNAHPLDDRDVLSRVPVAGRFPDPAVESKQ